MNDTIQQMMTHRSIRAFRDQPLPQALLIELIQAGQAAATSSHVQAYSIIQVTTPENREKLAELAGGQPWVTNAGAFLVFCADMKRPSDAAARTGTKVVRGMTEQLLVATVDAALVAQNVVVAAESEGLGICYIGGLRNNPEAVSELLRLPDQVYPVFGLCLGYPDQDKIPEIKPRLPVEAVLKQDYYREDDEKVADFDATMTAYYQARSSANKNTDWSHNLTPLFDTKLRPHMREFLIKRGFEMK